MDNNKKNKIINTIVFIGLIIFTFTIPFIIFAVVYGIGDPPVYEKKDVLAYYGSIAGACFGGFITAAGLYFTLYQNTETFNTQRKIDKDNRDEDKINAVMPVLKFGQAMNLNPNMFLRTNHQSESTSTGDQLRLYIKNIGVGPALNIKIKIGDAYLNNLYNLTNAFDLGVNEIVPIEIRTKFDLIEKIIDENKYINILFEYTDVYNKKNYKYYINAIKVKGSSFFETFVIEKKEVVPIA